jgi:1-acyl-sn-glycerol-3-phosphate acyltransferase
MKRASLQKILTIAIKVLTRIHYEGLENIPTEGQVIIATNHLSRMDIPVLFCNPVRKDLIALVTTKYLAHPILKWIINTAEGIWINRDIADFSAIHVASQALQKGIALGISPEGTRSKVGGLLLGKPGVVMLALKSGAPIVPVGLQGTRGAFKKALTLRRPHIIARFGKAFHIPELHAGHRSEELKLWTDEVMCRIAALLPEELRGVYANYSRVKELLAAG